MFLPENRPPILGQGARAQSPHQLQRLGRNLASGSTLRALEPEGLRPTAVPPLEALNVFNVRLATDGEARSLEPAHAELHSIEGHDLDSVFA
jgi:hypothetical protein